jgi:RimJ/RimL family protein N-acetyltransferase
MPMLTGMTGASHHAADAGRHASSLLSQIVEAKPSPNAPTKPSRGPVEVLAPFRGLRTARLTLRPLLPGDRSQFGAILRSDEAYLHKGINVRRPGESIDQCFDRLLAACSDGDTSGLEWRRVGVLNDGRLAGMFQLLAIDHALLAKADAGWWVSRGCAGNGLATEAVAAMIEFALTDLPRGLGLVQVDAAIAPDNAPSQLVARRAGFQSMAGETTQVLLGDRFEAHDVWRVVVNL